MKFLEQTLSANRKEISGTETFSADHVIPRDSRTASEICLAGLNVSDSTLCRNDSGPRFFISPVRVRPIQKSKTFLDAEQEIEKLRFETLNLFDNYNRKCRKHELKMEKEKCYPQLHHSE